MYVFLFHLSHDLSFFEKLGAVPLYICTYPHSTGNLWKTFVWCAMMRIGT